MIRKPLRHLLLLIWLMVCLPFHLVLSQLPQHSMYLNNEIKFERLGIEQGLANNSATNLMQDQQGFIWFATNDGLTQYDGYTFTLFQNNPRDTNSLSDNSVNAVYEDRSGLIWVGLGGGGSVGVNTFDPVTGIWKHYANDPDNPNSIGSGDIHAILEDRTGMFWFASLDEGLTRYNPKTGQFTRFKNNPKHSLSLSNDRVSALLEDQEGRLWVGTGSGLDLFDPETNSFSHIVGDPQDSITFKRSDIHHIFEDSQGYLWLSTNNGVYVLEPDVKKYKAHYFMDPNLHNSLGSNRVIAVVQDREGNYWIATRVGLYRFDLHTGHFKLYGNKEYLPKEVFIHDLLVDQSGLVWVGTIGNGAYYFFPQPWKFRRYLNEANTAFGPGSNQIQTIFKASDGELYVTTSSSMLRFDSTQAAFSLAHQVPSTKENINDYFITSSCEEKPGVFWLGTTQKGIVRFDSHLSKETYIQHDSLDSESLASDTIDVLFKDSQGIIWIGSGGGRIGTGGAHLQWYDDEKNKFVSFDYLSDQHDQSLPGHGIRFIYEDQQGDLWIGVKGAFLYTGGGGVYQVNRKTGKIVHYNYKQGKPNSLSSNAITCLYEDKQGIFWLGSYGAGLTKLDTRTGKTTFYTRENGLQSNTIHAISGDSSGNLWLLASEGITRFNPASLETDWFDFTDGLGGSPVGMAISILSLTGNTTFKSEDGTIFFGSNNGLTVFHPERVQMNQFKPPLTITEFKVSGKSLPLDGKEITLAYHQNFFDIEFVALNFFSSGKNQYAYKLEGLDKDWVYTGTHREARYTSVSPGKYIFRVKGSNNDGVWNEEGTSIQVTVLPPWWQTWWAYSLYALLALGSILYIRHYEIKRLKLRQRAAYLSELDHLKNRFFANISHEFRTPLTLILGPAKKLMDKYQAPEDQSNLSGIQRNARRLLHLVNQLLDLSKLEAGKLKLEAVKSDIVAFLKARAHAFTSLADHKNIHFAVELPDEKIGAYFDEDKLEKIINNLLSNAFKFTSEGGIVKVKMQSIRQDNKDWIQIQVVDTGKGIPEEEINRIFDRFYQVDSSQTKEHEGTGIGLALTKELVELHHGTIQVESTPGQGSTFTMVLPLGKEHLQEEEIIQELPLPAEQAAFVDPNIHPAALLSHPSDNPLEKEATEKQAGRPVVLVVEDNQEVRRFIGDSISSHYQVQEAAQGVVGLEMAKALLPDLILSDVMMPQMDGYQLCEKIKTDELTAHIPVILLTARADRQSKLTGLETGADDYLSKPFDAEELLLIIRNRIEERRKMRERFSRDITLEPKQISITSLDEQFLRKVLNIIEEHMGDENFSIEDFSREAGYSHVQFYRKLKALTDQTPSQFLRTVRLKRAAALLQKRSDHITQIAYSVGFNSLPYFNKCFKDQFGMTPGQFAKTDQEVK